MTELLFQNDCYLRRTNAKVIATESGAIVLDKTIFVPAAPLQPNDLGKFFWHGFSGRVLSVDWKDGRVLHELAGPMPSIGQYVRLKLNWRRRYQMMRLRTAVHLTAGILARDFGEEGRLTEFSESRATVETASLAESALRHLEEVCCDVVASGVEISTHEISPNKDEEIRALSVTLEHPLSERLVVISDICRFRDYGFFVGNTTEIGRFFLEKRGRTSVEVKLSPVENQS